MEYHTSVPSQSRRTLTRWTSQRLLLSEPNPWNFVLDLINSLPEEHVTCSFNLRPVTYSEVMKMLTTGRSDCSTGAGQNPAKYFKLSADIIASPLTHILNSFITISSFLEALKVARVSPIPKVESPVESDHYRPIAILLAISKVYENSFWVSSLNISIRNGCSRILPLDTVRVIWPLALFYVVGTT